MAFQDRKRLKKTNFLSSLRLILLAHKASLHICLYVVAHIQPIKISREQGFHSLVATMSRPWNIMMLLKEVLLKPTTLRHKKSSAFDIENTIFKPILAPNSILDIFH